MSERIPLFEISWDRDEMLNAVESIGRGGYWAKGPFVDEFESGLEEFLGVDNAVVVNSGTTALVAALRAAGIDSGDEVIVPSMTFIATANAVRLVGAEPVFADIEADTYGLDPDAVREQVSTRTAGIIPVHLYGGPCRIDELTTIAEEHDLVVVEDAAEAFGTTFDDEFVGTIGDAGIYSFCQNKVLTTGEGGAVVTDDDELAREVRLYQSHGRKSGTYFEDAGSGEYVTLGTNIRMSDLTAAIGCAQLDKVDQLIAERQRAASQLSAGLDGLAGVRTPTTHPRGTHVYQLYTVAFDSEIDREAVIKGLDDRGIDSKVYWDTPVHCTASYSDMPTQTLPRTEELADCILSLPIYPALSTPDVDRIVTSVADTLDSIR